MKIWEVLSEGQAEGRMSEHWKAIYEKNKTSSFTTPWSKPNSIKFYMENDHFFFCGIFFILKNQIVDSSLNYKGVGRYQKMSN